MTIEDKNKHLVCSAEHAGALDTPLRKLANNPIKILKPYLTKGMKALDLGCGPGFFTFEMANLVGDKGKIVALDLQEEMLNKVQHKIKASSAANTISTHQCQAESLAITESFDFILAFYVIHEIPDQKNLFKEIKQILKPDGKMLIAEPWFHVNKKAFETMKQNIANAGFEIIEKPSYFFSRAIVIGHSSDFILAS
jgi:2-polyprenyl-3-methyl-5-hydroxy-6-metoxy-1,4-benzoquinol methylase